MKSFIGAVVLAIAIFISSMAYSKHLDTVSEHMVMENQKISQYLIDENYAEAAEAAKSLEEYIDDKKFTLAATIDHNNLDKIEMNMSQMKKYVECEQKADSLAYCEVLDMLFGHLPKNYKLKLENIL